MKYNKPVTVAGMPVYSWRKIFSANYTMCCFHVGGIASAYPKPISLSSVEREFFPLIVRMFIERIFSRALRRTTVCRERKKRDEIRPKGRKKF